MPKSNVAPPENLIHIKLEYNEGKEAKKDLLSAELYLVKLARALRAYKKIRLDELKERQKLRAKVSETAKTLGNLKASLPKPKMPEILKPKFGENISKGLEKESNIQVRRMEKTIEKKYDDSLERELQEIQEKLKALGRSKR